ncbi:MAG: hypothetical protein ACOZE5_03140 [Verrucomicrobiota bacterium]
MKKLLAPLLCALTVLLLGACTSNVKITTAGLQVDLVRLQRTGGGDLQVTWRLRNPNIVAYVFTRSVHTLKLNGTGVGEFTDSTRVGVPSLNQLERTAILTPASPAARAAVDQALAQGSAAYEMDSSLWLLMMEEKTEKLRFTSRGTVPLVRE